MNTYKCIVCQAGFTSYNPNPRFCSVNCKSEFQAPDIDISEVSRLYGLGHTQVEIGQRLGVSQKSIHKAMRRHGLPARTAKKRNQHGSDNDSWKGNAAGYAACHRRLYAKYGKPDKCSVCNTTEADNYDYANLTGKYHDIDDYKVMCRSCHWKFDGTINNIKHMREEK